MMASLVLKITSPQRKLMGPDAVKAFDSKGGTIGRSKKNDWVLPDTHKIMSSHHALIAFQDNEFFITDLSLNGIYANGSKKSLGKGNTISLSQVHTLYLGEYFIKVRLQTSENDQEKPAPFTEDLLPGSTPTEEILLKEHATHDPLDLLGSSSAHDPFSDNLELPEKIFSDSQSSREYAASPSLDDAFVPPGALHTTPETPQTAPETPSGIPENWDQTSLSSIDSPNTPQAVQVESDNLLATAPTTDGQSETSAQHAVISPPYQPQKQYDSSQLKLAKASFKANGLDPSLLEDSYLVDQSLALMPYILNGILATLRSRAEVKNELRASKTIMQSVENNPLKFSVDLQDAVQNLLINQRPGFLNPTDSVKQAFDDLTQHEAALITGIQASLNALFQKISPDAIAIKIDSLQTKKNFFGKVSSSKKWDYYKETYQLIMENSSNSFIDMFGDDFVNGYESYITHSKQSGK